MAGPSSIIGANAVRVAKLVANGTPDFNNTLGGFVMCGGISTFQHDPTVNAKIAALKQQPSLNATVNSQWAALDAQVMRKAAWAPYVNRQFTDFFSTDIDLSCYVNHVLYQFDFSRICKK